MNEENLINLDTSLAFDLGKQAAILGWCLRDKLFALQCSHAVKAEWFSSPNVSKLYGATVKLVDELGRVPTASELRQYRPLTQEDAARQQKLTEALVDAIKKTEIYGLDLLRKEMTSWMHAVIFYQAFNRAQTLYNAKKVEEAWKLVEDATLLKITGTFEDGVHEGFTDSVSNVEAEAEERLRQSSMVLPYGVKFLDDANGGIIPNDLVVLGAKTGAGKTQLATAVALATSEAGHDAHFFALEAERYEIERRIKYGMMSAKYYSEGCTVPISYKLWRMGKLENLLKPYEEKVREELHEKLRHLHVLYRTTGDFNLRALERHLIRIMDKTRLIVLDHLHYIDTDDQEENTAYKATMKLVRDAVLRYGVPVIVVAHLRKNQGYRKTPLVSGVEDFHGTSDVPKIATTCVMLGPAHDHSTPKPYLWPTYINVVKSRLDGSVNRYTGLTHFDTRTSRYSDSYRVGRLNAARDEWEELAQANLPAWANVEQLTTDHKLG